MKLTDPFPDLFYECWISALGDSGIPAVQLRRPRFYPKLGLLVCVENIFSQVSPWVAFIFSSFYPPPKNKQGAYQSL